MTFEIEKVFFFQEKEKVSLMMIVLKKSLYLSKGIFFYFIFLKMIVLKNHVHL